MIGITERGDAALNDGWVVWVLQGRPTILITKDPTRLMVDHMNELTQPNANVIVHCTITGYGNTLVEPNVPRPIDTIAGMCELETVIGWDRIVLRVDPVVPTKKGIAVAKNVAKCGKVCGIRTRISFIDLYPHVIERHAVFQALPWQSLHVPLELRIAALEELSQVSHDELEVCGEPDMECTGCISTKDLEIFKIAGLFKDVCKQRTACACLDLKHELLGNRKRCAHGCLYCYWKD